MKTIDPSNAAVAQADVTTQAVQAAQDAAEVMNAAKRQAERQAKFDAWIDPEAMIHRRALNDLKAVESLWALRASGNAVTQTPIPPPEELPKEMRGQSPSTIRAMLRGNPDWEKKVKAHQELEASRGGFREKYPELFGLDDAGERRLVEKGKAVPTDTRAKAHADIAAVEGGKLGTRKQFHLGEVTQAPAAQLPPTTTAPAPPSPEPSTDLSVTWWQNLLRFL